jgi:DNA transposition AAA+ family ATPase
MITEELKQRVVEALAKRRETFGGTDAKFAIHLGISHSQYSRIKRGDTKQVLSDANWISLARKLEVPIGSTREWKTAPTPTYKFITGQLEFCRLNAASRILCDVPDIGKTYTARLYARSYANVVYCDCSQVKTRQKLIRHLAKEFGVGHTGFLSEVQADLVFYLRSLPQPLIILDEAGDLEYQAFLELKALWNATERCVGWYMMGADGLREKMRRSIDFKKVGYAELFSRYGNRYQKASPDTGEEMKQFKAVHAAMIIKANSPETVKVQQLISSSDYSLRRIYDEITKSQAENSKSQDQSSKSQNPNPNEV